MTAYLLNILDLLFTLHAISHGGTEVNPLMRNVPFMIFYKTIVIGALLWWLRVVKVNTAPLAAVFAVVDAWHIWNIFLL